MPRSPEMGEWGRKVGDVRISYQGEIVEKGQRLTLDQVLPGLPPAGYGASVPLVELCEGVEGKASASAEQSIVGGGDASGDAKASDSCLPCLESSTTSGRTSRMARS